MSRLARGLVAAEQIASIDKEKALGVGPDEFEVAASEEEPPKKVRVLVTRADRAFFVRGRNRGFYVEPRHRAPENVKVIINMEDFAYYLENFVEPTIAEFQAKPTSVRHAFLACLVTFHAVDYRAFPKASR